MYIYIYLVRPGGWDPNMVRMRRLPVLSEDYPPDHAEHFFAAFADGRAGSCGRRRRISCVYRVCLLMCSTRCCLLMLGFRASLFLGEVYCSTVKSLVDAR